MKRILIPKFMGLVALLFASGVGHSQEQMLQPPPCPNAIKTKYINTGYDYHNGTLVSDGANDPKWKISNFTSLFMCCFEPPASPSFPATGVPAVVLDLVSTNLYNPTGPKIYAPNTATSKWINHSTIKTDWLRVVDEENGDCYYSMTFARDFEVCDTTETLNYNFTINRDNWIRSVKIAGQVVLNDEASYSNTHPCHDLSNPSTAKHPCRPAAFFDGTQPARVAGTLTMQLIPQTLYSIEIEVGNSSTTSGHNPVSLQLDGYIHSNNYIIED